MLGGLLLFCNHNRVRVDNVGLFPFVQDIHSLPSNMDLRPHSSYCELEILDRQIVVQELRAMIDCFYWELLRS